MDNTLYGETEPETCIFFFFELITIKTQKCIQITLYENTKGNYEKSLFLSFLGTKTLKRMFSNINKDITQHYQKHVF